MKLYELDNIIKKNGLTFNSAQIDKVLKALEYVKFHAEMLDADIPAESPTQLVGKIQEIADRIKKDLQNRECPLCGKDRFIGVYNCDHTTMAPPKITKAPVTYPVIAVPCPACNKTAGEEAIKRLYHKAVNKGHADFFIARLECCDLLEPLMYILKTVTPLNELNETIEIVRTNIYRKPANKDNIPVDFSLSIDKLTTDSVMKIQ